MYKNHPNRNHENPQNSKKHFYVNSTQPPQKNQIFAPAGGERKVVRSTCTFPPPLGDLSFTRAHTLKMGFTIPHCAESDSWGPPLDEVDQERALTYAPFTRSDKFGRGAYISSPSPMRPIRVVLTLLRPEFSPQAVSHSVCVCLCVLFFLAALLSVPSTPSRALTRHPSLSRPSFHNSGGLEPDGVR